MFVPISVSQSPVSPDSQFIIVLRTSENVLTYRTEGWFTSDIAALSKKFVTKTITLDQSFTPGSYHMKLTQKLREFHTSEKLNLIGGFQEDSKLQLLMFKNDRELAGEDFEIFIGNYQADQGETVEDQRVAIESLINQAHLDSQGILRCSIAIGD